MPDQDPDQQPRPGRFLTLDDVATELATSRAQVYAMVRRDELTALRIGGRGQWRVERSRLEEYIARTYDETKRYIAEHPFEVDEAVENPAPAAEG